MLDHIIVLGYSYSCSIMEILSTHNVVSAGGVVYRIRNGQLELLLCGRLSPLLWALPKGTPESGESHVETAIREVSEETGLEVKIEGCIDSIQYCFAAPLEGKKFNKTVYFYLMSVLGGDIANHDQEFDVVRWFPEAETVQVMTHRNEVTIVEKGLSMVTR